MNKICNYTPKLVISTMVPLVLVGIGIIIFATTSVTTSTPHPDFPTLIKKISANQIRSNLQHLTEKPHIAGSDRDEVYLADFITQRFGEMELSVETHEFELLLSFPDRENKNYVGILDEFGNIKPDSISHYREPNKEGDGVDMDADESLITHPFLAYTPAGRVEGIPVYVNYGRIEDFDYLVENGVFGNNSSCSDSNCICFVRYGKIFRGNKIKHAEVYGCKGAVLFSDAADVAPLGEENFTYENGYYMPKEAAQRGTTKLEDGDPETPGYSSTEFAFRDEAAGKNSLTKIVSQAIGYEDARTYLQNLSGENVLTPENWFGEIENVTYNIGPGFAETPSETIILETFNYLERKTSKTVCATIFGKIEPDRTIIIGNHRDAWIYGGVDPSSGTAVLLELARVFSEIVQEAEISGNHDFPRRSIMFCSIGAEEHGLLGSYEFVEKFENLFSQQVVAYINMDWSVDGNLTLNSNGSPSLRSLIYETSKLINLTETETMYERWSKEADLEYGGLGSGSDFRPFVQLSGIPSLDTWFTGAEEFPLYHSQYETFYLVDKFIDPGFFLHKQMAGLNGEMIRKLADDALLPFDNRAYGQILTRDTEKFIVQFEKEFQIAGLKSHVLMSLVNKLDSHFRSFHENIEKGSTVSKSDLYIRRVNDHLMYTDRLFLHSLGLANRKYQDKHVLYAAAAFDSYITTVFPTLYDAFIPLKLDKKVFSDLNQKIDNAKREFGIICNKIDQAIWANMKFRHE